MTDEILDYKTALKAIIDGEDIEHKNQHTDWAKVEFSDGIFFRALDSGTAFPGWEEVQPLKASSYFRRKPKESPLVSELKTNAAMVVAALQANDGFAAGHQLYAALIRLTLIIKADLKQELKR